ncbi:hypothetical protein RhiXN_06529 [Rhizoctonia solani]|uniref:Zinc finger C2H2 LYAR-type domain-containing protein n=1 Tax=Rhizoctonia solani TaxID=456999 RepID=A0A8H8NZI4_9AGAM|nr:uncharacterized protein RhiXN_06529 [Rhizoctonia solani]QRW21540.1 hypothetical protein RhiXN_06529 [Rhizoctonia solani]
MVSFQCDGCQDVVKKPKLDSHGARCYASFTCIDCSKTFAGPAQWKGHTSCISEEQKYHKSVYQEPRVGRVEAEGVVNEVGGEAEVADVPLNAWTAPPPDPVNNEPFNSNNWTASPDEVATAKQTPAATTSSINGNPEPEKKPKKSKKRKAEDGEAAEPVNTEPTPEEPAKKKKKKHTDEPVKKKSRKSEGGSNDTPAAPNGGVDPDATMADAVVEPATKKEKKKSKKSHKSKPADTDADTAQEIELSGIINGETPATVPLATFVNDNAPPPIKVTEESSKKKSKSTEVVAEPEPTSNGVELANGHGEQGKKEKGSKGDKKNKKNKKDKKNNQPDEIHQASLVEQPSTSEPIVPKEQALGGKDLIPVSTIEATAEKEKKDKKVKKDKKSKSNTDMLPAVETAPALAEMPTVESKKSKKHKSKKKDVDEDLVPATESVSNGAADSKEKHKKKSKRRDKEAEATAA